MTTRKFCEGPIWKDELNPA